MANPRNQRAPETTQGGAVMRSLAFVLPRVLPSLNQRLRTHWAKAGREQAALAWDVTAAIGGPHWFPRPPFGKARVSVVRNSAGALDPDSLAGHVKPLLDVLCVNSRVHPNGLGIIEDDAPDKCELIVTQHRASRGEGFTAVRIEELA